ncbi:MAG: type II secretion system protein [Elusimicrobiaceae bacterium]|nr:type II secretion system protein [Elusimicrobiaceae bacterium]
MKKGFTAIEIVITMVIFAVLLGLTVPKFIGLIHKAHEGSTKHELVRLRSAIAAYYGEHQGVYPTDNLSCLVPDYIEAIPTAKVPGFAPSAQVSVGNSQTALTETGGWAYINEPADPRFGDVFVNTTKTDSYGKAWHTH